MATRTIKSLKNFIETIDEIITLDRDDNEEYWFRGQANSKWELTPTVYRNDVFDTHDNNGPIQQLKFTRKDDFQDKIKLIHDGYKFVNPNATLSMFESVFIAQHRGLKTPVLDWTPEPLIALYFALSGAEPGSDAAVYILRTHLLNQNSGVLEGGKTVLRPMDARSSSLDDVFESVDNSEKSAFNTVPFAAYTSADIEYRIAQQSGKFTIHGPVMRPSFRWENTTVIDDKDGKSVSFADQLIIPSSMFSVFRKYLKILGITSENIYGVQPIHDQFIEDIDSLVPDNELNL